MAPDLSDGSPRVGIVLLVLVQLAETVEAALRFPASGAGGWIARSDLNKTKSRTRLYVPLLIFR